jgi:hypothetical protein
VQDEVEALRVHGLAEGWRETERKGGAHPHGRAAVEGRLKCRKCQCGVYGGAVEVRVETAEYFD